MRLYDRRMAGGAGSSAATAWRAPLVAGFVPTHLKAALLRPRTFGYSRRAARLPPHALLPAVGPLHSIALCEAVFGIAYIVPALRRGCELI